MKRVEILRVNVSVAGQEGVLHGFTNLVGLGLPCAQANTRHLVASVQGEHCPEKFMSVNLAEHNQRSLAYFVPFPDCEVDMMRARLEWSAGSPRFLDSN